jgi:hypothetical protein
LSTAHKSRHRGPLCFIKSKLSLPLEEPYVHGVTEGGKEKKIGLSWAAFCGHFLSTYGAPQMPQSEWSFHAVKSKYSKQPPVLLPSIRRTKHVGSADEECKIFKAKKGKRKKRKEKGSQLAPSALAFLECLVLLTRFTNWLKNIQKRCSGLSGNLQNLHKPGNTDPASTGNPLNLHKLGIY